MRSAAARPGSRAGAIAFAATYYGPSTVHSEDHQELRREMAEAPTERIQGPSPSHRAVIGDVLDGLGADRDVRGVLLCGSLARGTARPDSDVDLLVVLAAGTGDPGGGDAKRFSRTRHGAIEVEQSGRTAEGWRRQFAPVRVGDESWGYAFLDGVILHDPYGEVAELVAAAAEAHARYRVPKETRAHFAWLWGHLRPKMEAVLRRGDPVEIGWAAAVMMGRLTDTLWAASGRPLPSRDLGTFQRHLGDLTVPPDAPALVRELLQAPPEAALRLQLRLLDAVFPHLQEAPTPETGE
jgi:hypothetical protein